MSDSLVSEYQPKLSKLLPLAKKAYGSRSNISPAHDASREYTKLLKDYYDNGGSLVTMAEELGVAYASLRRRVMSADTPVAPARKRSRFSTEEVEMSIQRVKAAKAKGTDDYHKQLAKEYNAGASLAKIATGLGISSSQPLYWAVQRAHEKEVRHAE
jgi:hypothetical protein